MARGSQPKYLAIYADLRSRILDGRLAPGERLASQLELAERYGVTVMTLRQAVGELEAEGLLRVSRGRGSFVVDQPLRYRVGNLTSFAQQVTAQGLDLVTEYLGHGPPEARVDDAAEALGVEAGALVEIRRRRLVSDRPVVLQQTLVSKTIADQLSLEQLGTSSLYELVAVATGHRVARARETLRAVALDPVSAGLLGQEPGSPAMRSVRISLTSDGTPFLFDRALLVGDAASIEADRHVDRLELTYSLDV